jgi:nitric oxide reductase large subunit
MTPGILLAVDVSRSMTFDGLSLAKEFSTAKDIKQVLTFSKDIIEENADLSTLTSEDLKGEADFGCVVEYFRHSEYQYLTIYTNSFANVKGIEGLENRISFFTPISGDNNVLIQNLS